MLRCRTVGLTYLFRLEYMPLIMLGVYRRRRWYLASFRLIENVASFLAALCGMIYVGLYIHQLRRDGHLSCDSVFTWSIWNLHWDGTREVWLEVSASSAWNVLLRIK